MRKGENINWLEIKMFYVTADVDFSYGELAKRFEVSKTAIYEKSQKENWKELREKYLTKMITKIQDVVILDKAQRRRRALDVLDSLLMAGLQKIGKEIKKSNGEYDITVPQLVSILDLERKLMNNEFGHENPKKRLNKNISDCTPEELDAIIRGEAIAMLPDRGKNE